MTMHRPIRTLSAAVIAAAAAVVARLRARFTLATVECQPSPPKFMEGLENRRLLTASLGANGQLVLTSVVFAFEQYTVTFNGTDYTVDIFFEGFHAQYPRAALTSIIVNCNTSGSDTLPGDIVDIDTTVSIPVTVNGTGRDDVISTGNGDSIVNAGGGADLITCGNGNDTVNAGNGRAAVGMDITAADDTVFGGGGNDLLRGEGSPDPTKLGDILIGGAGDDTLIGGQGRDVMDGGSGTNTLSYEDKTPDVDVIFPNRDDAAFNAANPIAFDNFPKIGFGEVVTGGGMRTVTEHDQLYKGLDALLPAQITYDSILVDRTALLDETGFQRITAGDGDDVIDVSLETTSFTLSGNDGTDTIFGSSAGDMIDGGDNPGGAPNEILEGFAGNDTIHGGAGPDSIDGGAGDDSLFGDDGNDFIHGDDPLLPTPVGNDYIDGGNGDDLITGDRGDGSLDTTASGGGNDTLVGGSSANGADTLQGDGGFDLADYSGAPRPFASPSTCSTTTARPTSSTSSPRRSRRSWAVRATIASPAFTTTSDASSWAARETIRSARSAETTPSMAARAMTTSMAPGSAPM